MSPTPDGRIGPEFSRPFAVESLGAEEAVERIEATERECAAVARRLNLVALHRLSAELRVMWRDGDRVVEVRGHLEAEVTQSCVVSLAPLFKTVSEDFTALYAVPPAGPPKGDGRETNESRAGRGAAAGGAKSEVIEVDALGDDPPEGLGPDGLDLGEAVVQQLAMALDPYPRGEGASLEALGWRNVDGQDGQDIQDGGAKAKESPFKGLKTLIEER